MIPSQQRFETLDPATLDVDLRLVVKDELLVLERPRKAGNQERPLVCSIILRRLVELTRVPSQFLRSVHGVGSPLDQQIWVGSVVRKQGDADTRVDVDLMAFDQERLADHLHDPLGNAHRVLFITEIVEEADELVAAEARDTVLGSEGLIESLRNTPEDTVCDPAAEGGIEQLEVIEIEEQDGEGPAVSPGTCQRDGEPVAEQ